MIEIKHTLTAEDLELNPSLADQDLKEGDEVALTLADDLAKLLVDHKQLADTSAEEIERLVSVNKSLQDQLAAAPEEPAPVEPETPLAELEFEHDGKKYGFALRKIQLDRVVVTAEEVAASDELQAQLIEIGSGMIFEK